MKESIYTHQLNQTDPLFLTKWVTINSFNEICDSIRGNHRDMRNQVFMILTILISIFIGFLVNSNNYVGILFLSNLLMILLIFFAYPYYKKRKELAKNKDIIVEGARKLNIPIHY